MFHWALITSLLIAAGSDAGHPIQPSSRLENIARAGIESVLSFVLEAKTEVGQVELDRENGVLTVKDLRVANPGGFSAQPAISVGTIYVEADPKVLFSPEPVVHLLKLGDPKVNAEMNLSRGSNLKKLLDSAGRFPDNRLMKNLPRKKWRIEKGVLGGCRVTVVSSLLREGAKDIQLEDMEMSFLGKDGRGMTADEAMAKFLSALLDKLGLASKDSPVAAIMELLRH